MNDSTARGARLTGYWLVCLGTLGVQYAYSALFVVIMDKFLCSRAQAALVGAWCAGIMDGLGIIMGTTVIRLGFRRACIMGGLLSATGLAISAFATEWWHLIISYSIVVGERHTRHHYGHHCCNHRRRRRYHHRLHHRNYHRRHRRRRRYHPRRRRALSEPLRGGHGGERVVR